jgi:peroxiredoxin
MDFKKIGNSAKVKKWFWNLLIVLMLFMVIGYFQNRHLLETGKKAPEFNLVSLQGDHFNLKDLAGKQVVVYFWATWCSVCKLNIPVLNGIVKKFQEDPVFISIVADSSDLEKIKKIYQEKEIAFPVLLATPEVMENFKVRQFPTTYFINRQSLVYSRDSGFLTPFGLWWRIFLGKFF